MKVQKYLQNVLISVSGHWTCGIDGLCRGVHGAVVNASPVVKVIVWSACGDRHEFGKATRRRRDRNGNTSRRRRFARRCPGSDGMYSFAELPPGEWTLTAEVEGYPDAAVPPLQVVASKPLAMTL